MFYHRRITKAKPRTALVLLVVCLLGTNGLAATRNSTASAGISATTTDLTGTVESTGSQDPAMLQQSQAAPSPTPRVPVATPGEGMTQSEQGRQYGQSGFVGEPINLNVVNADIRDILNYITEQYGVNFIIDSSVASVPVTVNVQDVPWNIALDAVLKANRLGVEVSGNILRVATTAVLAIEAGTQKLINESRLDASPLVTEFIRLNYAQSSGGASGGFASGRGAASTSGAVASGGGILPIIQRRLSKRGGIEVDQRSNTIIVTDVAENIFAIRQLVALLDQPEPQVEIEARIVIANRNFSRDLGVQLSAAVLNLGRGGVGSASNLPGGPAGGVPPVGPPTIAAPPVPASPGTQFGIPGGLNGGPLASAASTVIGLTTGIFGTAQISALITAGETKGQAKTIATPRVTVLNNKTAEISSGTQLPVQTVGELGVVTTEFVEVPLRLEITPQITDAGTVVMQIVIENANINTGVLINGIPLISTQKLMSEVIVPDGGTTVMGGVLQDTESNAQQRTPGLASIPLLGNLFKRKQIIRTTDEILFFITPRINRTDLKTRPPSGTRSTTISQPVPLGNPPTNTPGAQTQPTQQTPGVAPVTGAPTTPVP